MSGCLYFFGDGQADGAPNPPRADLLGGKGASLAALTRAGLPVPPGFVISTECCGRFLAVASGGRWPDGLKDEVRAAMARLETATGRTFGDPTRPPLLVSVRSGAAVSMPGMMDTILNCGIVGLESAEAKAPNDKRHASRNAVLAQFCAMFTRVTGRQPPGEPWADLFACIEAVFNSWNNPRAVAYRQERGITGLAGTAVTVQAMFPSQVSGVAFTANPTAPDRRQIVIESSFGLGEAIVSGNVHPDRFVLERAEQLSVVERSIGHKSHVVLALGDSPPPVLFSTPDAPSLTDAQVVELAALALKVESLFGQPVDVEWGLDADGRFALLQARPIRLRAANPGEGEKLLAAERARLRDAANAGRNGGPWVLHNLAETLPHPTPLSWSVMRSFMSGAGGFGAMYRLAGFEPGERACREGILRLIAGRIYMDASTAGEMFFADFPFRYDVDQLRSDFESADRPPSVPAGSVIARWRARRRIARCNARLGSLSADFDRQLRGQIMPAFAAWCAAEKRRGLAAMSLVELASAWREREHRVLDQFAPQSLLPSLIGEMALARLRECLAESFWNEDSDELASALAAPAQPDCTVRANGELYAVAAGRRTVEQWLADHGHRAAEEFDLASPRWRERPADLANLAAQLRDGADPLELHHARQSQTEARLDRLRRRLNKKSRRELDARISLARRYLAFREDSKYHLMLGYDLLRDVALEAGRRLGIGDDVFMLSRDEMLGSLDRDEKPRPVVAGDGASVSEPGRPRPRVGGASSQPGAAVLHREMAQPGAAVLQQRRREYRLFTRVTLPRVIDASNIDEIGRPPKVDPSGSFAGVGLSSGAAAGPARIMRSLTQEKHASDGAGFQPAGPTTNPHGYILVCPSTDPSWTPLFVNAAGVVLECGGVLSHGALVAREMGIPAVVLPGATNLFSPGEPIALDGATGAIRRGDAPAGGEAPAGTDRPPGRVPARFVPPPPGPIERVGRRARWIMLSAWGAFLLAAFLLPEAWLYAPTMTLLDRLLWPMVRSAGPAATVAIVAGALALATMLAQRLLADNARLRQARRRSNWLARKAGQLPAGSSARRELLDVASPVNLRLLAAAMTPLTLLLGPMVMTFTWFPARVAPQAWSPPPGASVVVVADLPGDCQSPVRIEVDPPLQLEPACPAAQTLPPIRPALERLLGQWEAGATTQPVVSPDELGLTAAEASAALRNYLANGERSLAWTIRSPAGGGGGAWAVRVFVDESPATEARIVLGRQSPPGATTVAPPGRSPLRAIRVVYPQPEEKRVFCAPFGFDLGWLGVYLAVYLPVMFAARWALRVA